MSPRPDNSLNSKLAAVSESLFFEKALPPSHRLAAAEWIARRRTAVGQRLLGLCET